MIAIAWRNLMRNRVRTGLTASGIAFAVFLVSFAMSLQAGSYGLMIDAASRFFMGHGEVVTDAFVDKDDELRKQVVVLTHQFVEHNQGRLDDRGIFVIDEAIYATGEATLKLHHFGEALSWATRNGVLVEEFIKLHELVNDLNKELHESDKKYIAAPHQKDLRWANTIAHELQLSNHSQTIDDNKVLVAVQRFCEALLSGLVFFIERQHR